MTDSSLSSSPAAPEQAISPSQEVARSVLAAQPAAAIPSSAVHASQLARFKAAASAPEGSTDNPIQVSIVER